MLASVFFRLLKLIFTSIICSLPIFLEQLAPIKPIGILLLSFIAFVVIIGHEAYSFSFEFYNIQDYYVGLLLPFVIYSVLGFSTCLLFKPIVFNRIFLPLRFAGSFGIRTNESIVIVSIVMLAIITILRIFGARAGRITFVAEREKL